MKIRAVCVIVALGAGSAAWADFVHPLLGAAGASASGSQTFYSAATDRAMDVQVDWAVFEPGAFAVADYSPLPNRGGGMFAPLNAGHYVYAYQIFNRGAGEGSSTVPISSLSIDFGAPIASLGTAANYDAGGLGVMPGNGLVRSTSYWYYFASDPIAAAPAEYSKVLLMSSASPPATFAASIFDSGLSANGPLPSAALVPLPPAALSGLAMLVLMAGSGCVWHARKSGGV